MEKRDYSLFDMLGIQTLTPMKHETLLRVLCLFKNTPNSLKSHSKESISYLFMVLMSHAGFFG
jgi:hypothetical protein